MGLILVINHGGADGGDDGTDVGDTWWYVVI